MFRLLDLKSAEFVHDGNHEWYKTPPLIEFQSRETAEQFIERNIFLWKHRGNFYGIISKISADGLKDEGIRFLGLGVWVPRHQLEVIEAP